MYRPISLVLLACFSNFIFAQAATPTPCVPQAASLISSPAITLLSDPATGQGQFKVTGTINTGAVIIAGDIQIRVYNLDPSQTSWSLAYEDVGYDLCNTPVYYGGPGTICNVAAGTLATVSFGFEWFNPCETSTFLVSIQMYGAVAGIPGKSNILCFEYQFDSSFPPALSKINNKVALTPKVPTVAPVAGQLGTISNCLNGPSFQPTGYTVAAAPQNSNFATFLVTGTFSTPITSPRDIQFLVTDYLSGYEAAAEVMPLCSDETCTNLSNPTTTLTFSVWIPPCVSSSLQFSATDLSNNVNPAVCFNLALPNPNFNAAVAKPEINASKPDPMHMKMLKALKGIFA